MLLLNIRSAHGAARRAALLVSPRRASPRLAVTEPGGAPFLSQRSINQRSATSSRPRSGHETRPEPTFAGRSAARSRRAKPVVARRGQSLAVAWPSRRTLRSGRRVRQISTKYKNNNSRRWHLHGLLGAPPGGGPGENKQTEQSRAEQIGGRAQATLFLLARQTKTQQTEKEEAKKEDCRLLLIELCTPFTRRPTGASFRFDRQLE